VKAARLLSRYLMPAVAATIAIIPALVAPAHAADIGKGQRIYSMHCSVCHGPTGLAVMPGAPNFARNERLLQPDMSLVMAVRTGKNAMPAFMGILNDREILDVIAYLRTLFR
jgi:cytochrome c6